MQISTFKFPAELNTGTVLPLIFYPNKQLATPVQEIDQVTNDMLNHAADMVATMISNNGIGLASNQTKCTKPARIATFNFSSTDDENILAIFNPSIVWASNPKKYSEGCLSFPGIFQEMTRNHHIVVRGRDYEWNEQELELIGIPAICVQHEIDHLNGKTFADDLSILKKSMIKKKLKNNVK